MNIRAHQKYQYIKRIKCGYPITEWHSIIKRITVFSLTGFLWIVYTIYVSFNTMF